MTDLFGPAIIWTCLQSLTKGYLTSAITECFRSLADEKPSDTWLILTNPIAERWTREVPNDRLIYWNYDDYLLYDLNRQKRKSDFGKTIIKPRALCPMCFPYAADTLFRTIYNTGV